MNDLFKVYHVSVIYIFENQKKEKKQRMKIYKGENQCQKLQGKLNKLRERKEKVKLEEKKKTRILMIAEKIYNESVGRK